MEDRSVFSLPSVSPHSIVDLSATDGDISADVFLPEAPPRLVLVLVHGGFWRPEFDRAHLRPLREDEKFPGMNTAHQFALLSGPVRRPNLLTLLQNAYP